MRGKRTAMPLLCRGLRLMPSKPSSNTSVGRTLRTGPNFSSVVCADHAVDRRELLVAQARVGLGERHQLQRAGLRPARAVPMASTTACASAASRGARFHTAKV